MITLYWIFCVNELISLQSSYLLNNTSFWFKKNWKESYFRREIVVTESIILTSLQSLWITFLFRRKFEKIFVWGFLTKQNLYIFNSSLFFPSLCCHCLISSRTKNRMFFSIFLDPFNSWKNSWKILECGRTK